MNQSSAQAEPASASLLFYGFLALLFWLPLPLGSNRWWALALFELAAMILAMVWLVLYLRGRLTTGAALAQAAPALFLLVAALAWMCLQIVPLPPAWIAVLSPEAMRVHELSGSSPTLSLNPFASRAALFESLSLVLVFCLTLVLVNSRQRLRALSIVLIVSGVCQAAYGSLMTLSGLEYGFVVEKEAYRGVATGTFVNRNHLAGYLELCLAVGIGLLLSELAQERSPHWRAGVRRFLQSMLGRKGLLRLSLVVMVIALVLTRSRMGNIAFFASLGITGLLYLSARRRITRSGLLFFASLLVVDLLIVGNFFGVEKVVQRLQETSAVTEHRDEVVQESLQIIADYPLSGTGAGSYYSTYPSYSTGVVPQVYDHTHNDYVEIASELGLVGFALLAAAVIYCLYLALRALFRRRDPVMQGCAFACVMGTLALLIHSLTDFNLQIPANAALFVVILALGVISASGRFAPVTVDN
ncbi:O-antigen ligase family protein [Parahaliea aestuarii]|uniref:O-antigen ligase family protein n=1 Tax=Parahaliea aestuarii TaxID=1852021 RepID=A0A5C8ZS22_9GAMM|nr:O-antigen ligase family protein [Parahaliea aestuarii]TXS90460.1 O-antigen ligase family protein [Parahaliea aestuarii]